MYETFTYNQIKDLPEDQKIEALKELKILYPDNKDLAKHLNVIPMAIGNMVAKYLEGKQLGRKKMTDEEKAQAKLQRENEKKLKQQQEGEKEKEKVAQQEKSNEQKADEVIKSQEIKNEETNVKSNEESIKPQSNAFSFSIKLDKNMTSEEAVSRLNGIANSLLKEKEYRVELIIVEA